MFNKCFVLVCLVLAVFSLVMMAACAPALTPEVIEKVVKETVVVEKEVPVEVTKVVKETVVVEKEIIVEVEVTPVPAVAKPAVDKDTVVICRGDLSSARNLSPIMSWARVMYDIGWNVWDGLMDWEGEPREVVPRLADSWEVSDDGLAWTFHLHEGVTWHDGTPFTAEDVKFTIEAIQTDVSTFGSKDVVDLITEVIIVDPLTVQLVTEEPYSTLDIDISRMGIAPKHVLEGQDLLENDFNSLPIGTGPYRAVKRDGDDVTLEAYEGYWREGLPRTKQLIYRSIPDMAARAAAIRAGEIDIVDFDATTMKDIEKEGLEIHTTPALTFWYLVFNHTRPIFQDKNVRQALSYALDRKMVVELAMDGLGTPALGPLNAQNLFFSPDVHRYDYDPAKAAALLEESGWQKNADGIYEKDGQTLGFSVLCGGSSVPVALVYQQNWRDLGIDVELDVVEDGALRNSRARSSDFDMFATASGMGMDPIANPFPVWYGTDAPFNWSLWSNPEFDALVEKARTVFDAEERLELNKEAVALLVEELPWLYVAHWEHGYVSKPGLKGVILNEWDWAVGMDYWYWEE